MGFTVWGLGFGVWGLRLKVYGLWFVVYGLWFMVYGLWCMVYGLWFMVDDLPAQGGCPERPGGSSPSLPRATPTCSRRDARRGTPAALSV